MLLPLLLNNLMAAPVVVHPAVATGGTPTRRTPRLAPWSVPVPQLELQPSNARRRRERDDELLALFKP